MILGVGTDIASIDRVSKVFKKFNERFLNKCFHPAEISIFKSLNPIYQMAFLAKRFAAKEAFSKALGTGLSGNCSLRQIYIYPLPSGQPEIRLDGETAVFFETWYSGPKKIHVSLSDDGGNAIAFVIIEEG